jgi:gamma-glutamyltranspeptidase/glutathione hydrolase
MHRSPGFAPAAAAARRPLRHLLLALALAATAACSSPIANIEPQRAAGSLGLPPGAPLPPDASAPAHLGDAGTAGRAFRGGVVTTSEPEAAVAAARVLAQGGNAIDAAAVAQFVLGVVEPQSSGIGGGGFLMIYLAATGQTVIVDARETAPAAATPDMFGGAPFAIASTSGIAVGVPGTLLGIDYALKTWGTISLADALAPAIGLARDGFIVGPRLADSLGEGFAAGGRLANEPSKPAYAVARRVFAPDGSPPVAGERLLQPDLAATLDRIATRGPAALYDCGDGAGIAASIIATQRAYRGNEPALGGRMTCDDLAAAAAAGPGLRQPVVGHYRGFVIKSMPPPSSGGLCLVQMLAVLERFPIGDRAAGFGFGTASTLGVMQEAMRLCFADRAMWMGDTDVVADLPIAGLIDRRYIDSRADSCPHGDAGLADYCIVPDRRLTGITAGDPRPPAAAAAAPVELAARRGDGEEGIDTTHLTIVDRWGNIVTYTTTIESAWGTGLMVPGRGFLLNNELTDFNLTPRANGSAGAFDPGANDVAPNKRPRSSMAPTILFAVDAAGIERPVVAFGSPGGASIINTVLDVTLNLIDHGMDIQTAIDAPRLSLTSAADKATTAIETGFDPGVLARLTALGYRFGTPAPLGSVQATVIDPRTGEQYGGADGRRRGTVIGLSPAAGAP